MGDLDRSGAKISYYGDLIAYKAWYEMQLTMQLIYFSEFDRNLVLTDLLPAVDDLLWIAKNMDMTLYIKEPENGWSSLIFKYRFLDLVASDFIRDNELLDIEWKGEHFYDFWMFGERLENDYPDLTANP